MKKLLYAVTITFILILSMRLVVIATPLNVLEKISLVGMMFEYSMLKSRKQELDDKKD